MWLRNSFACWSSLTGRVPNAHADFQTAGRLSAFWRGGYIDPQISAELKAKMARSGDAWPQKLLFNKSTEDLHKLWYVLLKEKNFLLSERNAFAQQNMAQPRHGRLKKVKLGMKRILKVVTRREYHEQCLRGREILAAQTEREKLELKRHNIEETVMGLQHKLERLGAHESIQRVSWTNMLQKACREKTEIQSKLEPLRLVAMQGLLHDWRFSKKYSDLPGRIRWNPMYVRALADRHIRRPRHF